MPAANLSQLHTHLKRDPPASIYLLAGQEPLLLQEAADAVRAAARRHGFDERTVLEADEKKFDWGSLAAASQQGSLFGTGRKLIDLRLPSGKPGREGAPVLIAAAQARNPDVIVLITCMEWGKVLAKAAWVEAVASGGWYVPIWPIKRDELPDWIAARARSRGLDLAADAVDLLALRTEGNLLACAQEIDKLLLLGESGALTAARLEGLLAEQSRLDVFALSDAVMAGDTLRALRVLRSLHAEGELPVPVLSWLGGQVELLARVGHAHSRGQPIRQALRTERVWDSRMAMYEGALRRLGAAGIRRGLQRVAQLDRVAKGQAPGDAWLLLERLVLILTAAGRGRRAA
ncbi:MAG: DNA polymerase III subunit delta [Xanthomonadales bacterium]|nr:DNA polymerase III subunit delta [Xanthomonadales bacterium]